MKKRYNDTQKQKIVRLYEKGEKVKKLCFEFEICKSTLYNWIALYKKTVSPSGEVISARNIYLNNKVMERLKIENHILRKSGCSLMSPIADKLVAITTLQGEYSIHALCNTLGVLRSTYYHHLKKKETWFQKEEDMLKPKIRKIFEDSKQRYGSKKIRAMLMREGITISKERVIRLMRDMELNHVYTKPKRVYAKENKDKSLKNKLNQEFTQIAPNRVWVSDISYIKINKNATFYICVVIDLFSRKVISCHTSDECSSYFAIETFNEAYEKREHPKSLMFHSDRGVQYTAYEFRQHLRKCNVEQSFSNTGYPYDNAVAESFFAMMKKEELYRHEYTSLLQLKRSIKEYVIFYNSKRIHESLTYLTPDEVESQYSA